MTEEERHRIEAMARERQHRRVRRIIIAWLLLFAPAIIVLALRLGWWAAIPLAALLGVTGIYYRSGKIAKDLGDATDAFFAGGSAAGWFPGG